MSYPKTSTTRPDTDRPVETALDAATEHYQVEQYWPASGQCNEHIDTLASEVPVALQYNGTSHVVMLASGMNLTDLAYGFSYTEGIIRRPSDIYDCEVHHTPQGYVLDITIASACMQQLKLRRRRMTGQTGCGLCGIESLEALDHALQPLPTPAPNLDSAAIEHALHTLAQQQPLRQRTGATHAAGWANFTGEIQLIREDVGRHNALDKLIGALLREERTAADGFAVVSSRASYEMVQKTIQAQIPALVAVSAPTSLAVKVARDHHLILVGFARGKKFNIYHGSQYINHAVRT
ncbi:MAG TPA: formate dehydrogenase accessory sulfurtransferase FdhD [Paenalcaligenes sp.]|nr:formate dehydrogenase accessory sulfurtransferase FdhD [Paenalcaligenes sp.]